MDNCLGGKREGQVTQEVNMHSKQASELREIVEKMEVRLANVTRNDEIEKDAAPTGESPISVSLATEIKDANNVVADCIRRLGQLLGKIEI